MIRKKNSGRTNEVCDCSFCLFFLLVLHSSFSVIPLRTQVHLIPPKACLLCYTALRMVPFWSDFCCRGYWYGPRSWNAWKRKNLRKIQVAVSDDQVRSCQYTW